MQIVKQNDWESYSLSDGDKVELLDFVGGGWDYLADSMATTAMA
jgi:hypothetical protein